MTYGKNCSISIITDTKYFEDLESHYKGDILIVNVVLLKEKGKIQHLTLKTLKE